MINNSLKTILKITNKMFSLILIKKILNDYNKLIEGITFTP